jgi:hypothetical protein
MGESGHDNIISNSENILDNFEPQSAVAFSYDRGQFMIFPQRNEIYTDQQLLDRIKHRVGMSEYLSRAADEQIKAVIEDERQNAKLEGVGGFDLTHRTVAEMETILPGLEKRIRNSQGKVVILGNGLSLAPLEIVNLNKNKKDSPVIIVDFINYKSLLQDLENLQERFRENGLAFPDKYKADLNLSKKLANSIDSGEIMFVNYFIGGSVVPNEIKDASLVINIYGPDETSQEEQISLLAPGGVLIVNEVFEASNDSSIKIDPVIRNGKRVGSLITKIKQSRFFNWRRRWDSNP